MAEQKREDDPRDDWKRGSELEVFSDKAKKWFEGKIFGVEEDKDGEWLKITYKTDKKELMMRKIQRYSDQIRPIGGDIKNIVENDNKKKLKKRLSRAQNEIIYPADKYLEIAELELIESHEKGDRKTSINVLKKLNCTIFDIKKYNEKITKLAYVCEDGYILNCDILRISGDKKKICLHLGHDKKHYDINLKQKTVWINLPDNNLFMVEKFKEYDNPEAKNKKNEKKDNNNNEEDEIPNTAYDFFRQASGLSVSELQRHPSVEQLLLITKLSKKKKKDFKIFEISTFENLSSDFEVRTVQFLEVWIH